MLDLKNCPFCGSSGEELMMFCDPEEGRDNSGLSRRIQCAVCHVEAPFYPSEVEAIAAWNRRALQAVGPEPAVAGREKLNSAVDAVFAAVIDCPHEIEAESITLRFSPNKGGHNALFQLSGRIRSALVATPPAEQHPDEIAVDRFAAAMKAKLKWEREQRNRSGWQAMSAADLSRILYEHLPKGDPVDVANLSMMLHQNGQQIETPPAEPEVEEWREIEQHVQPRLADGYTAVAISKPGFWMVKGPGPAAALATKPAVKDDETVVEALRGTTASLVAAVSLLKRGSKKAAPSNKMFDQMIRDYSKSIEGARAALSGSGSGWRVPDGWKLVPVEPTEAMLAVGVGGASGVKLRLWQLMLAASPAAPQQGGE